MINKKKKKSKLKDHVVKDIYRSTLRREDVRENNKIRKEIYKAEAKKVQDDLGHLNNNLQDILDVTTNYIKNSK